MSKESPCDVSVPRRAGATVVERIEAAIAGARGAGHPVHYLFLSTADFEELNKIERRKSPRDRHAGGDEFKTLAPGDQWRGYLLEAGESLGVA